MKKKILLAGLDQIICEHIQKFVGSLGCEMTVLSDGTKALDFLVLNACDAVIADLDIPGINGFQLFNRAKSLGFKGDYILLANSRTFVTSEEAYEVGIKSFLIKPITKEVLTGTLIQVLQLGDKISEANPGTTPDSEFSAVPIGEFFSGGDLQFPIFLKLATDKYISIGKHEKGVDKSIIENLKTKKVKDLYLKKEDFIKYLGFMDFLSEASIRSSTISVEKKAKIVTMAARRILEFSFVEKVEPSFIYFAKSNLTRSIELLGSFGDVVDLLESAGTLESNLSNHNITTSMIALMIAKGRGWTSPITLFIVSASALFHDIALLPLEEDLKKSTPEGLTSENLAKYRAHPLNSAALIARYGKFPDAIFSVISQHHEKPDGTGFPKNLSKTEIHPIAEIVHVASEFAHYYLGAPGYGAGMYPRFAANKIREKFSGLFYEPNIEILEKIFVT